MTDKTYCMSSFLMFRTIRYGNKTFSDGIVPNIFQDFPCREPVHNSYQLEAWLKKRVEEETSNGKAALALSGGIDSAILAKFMPKGSVAYTFKCVVPGMEVTDETPAAAKYAKECGLEHRIVEIYWEDFERYAPVLMKHKGAPIHSIEVQIYKAALQAKHDGMEKLVFGESADVIYGGMDGLLSRDWLFGEFVNRYTHIMPYMALKNAQLILEPFEKYVQDGYFDSHGFVSEEFRMEGFGSYSNAAETAGIGLVCPYAETVFAEPMDYQRIRSGENKYTVREVFQRLYPDFAVPPKLPMPRAVDEWLKDWPGPVRDEFWPHCTDHMTGDQKWLVWALECFLNLLDDDKKSSEISRGGGVITGNSIPEILFPAVHLVIFLKTVKIVPERGK